jgi:hypothetical protein
MSIAENAQERTTEIKAANIPEELKVLKQWVNWAGIWNEEREKLNKPPMTANGRNASPTGEGTWTTLEKSLAAVGRAGVYTDNARKRRHVTLDGIGLAGLGRTRYTGVDLDNCVNPETGEINPAALEIVEALDSYTEISPSGEGLRILLEAGKPPTWCANKGGATEIEVYDKGRFLTVTGHHLEGTPRTIEGRQDALDAFMVEHAPPPVAGTGRPKAEYKGPEGYVLDLDGWLDEFGVVVFKPVRDATSERAYAIECPWAHEHTGGDTSGTKVGQYPSGAPWFKCWHGHCDGRRWEQFREELDPEAYRKVGITVGGRAAGGFSVVSGGRVERERAWPTMEEEAYRGIFGRIVQVAEEHTEGDPVALLASAFTAFGSAVGRGAYMQIGATRHHPNLFCAIVGDTAKGRKGSTWDPVENIMHASDRHWTEQRIQSGLSSGEGLISEVRDSIAAPDKDGKMRTVDAGVSDKRLLVQEGELSQALKVMKREGNTLSPVLRNAWDGKTLKTMVKHSPLRATSPHVSILGHITTGELVKHLTETEMANGLANRFVWMLVKRSKRLPFGGEWHTVNLQPISREIVGALEFAAGERRMSWAEDAKPLWVEAYDTLTEDRPGMFGAVTARAEAQTLRLAMLYALADCSYEIRRTHVESALAVWEYAEESARYIFGDAIGDADADKVLEELKAREEGMTRTEVRDLFGRNRSGEELDRVMEVLAEAGRIRVSKHREGGSKKPVERWHAA